MSSAIPSLRRYRFLSLVCMSSVVKYKTYCILGKERIGFRGKGNGWRSTTERVLVYGESFEGYRWKDSRLWVKGYGGIRWKGLKRRLFALKRHLFSLKRHLFEAKRCLFNCFHPRQTFLSPRPDLSFTYWRHISHHWMMPIVIRYRQYAAQVPGVRSMGSCRSAKH